MGDNNCSWNEVFEVRRKILDRKNEQSDPYFSLCVVENLNIRDNMGSVNFSINKYIYKENLSKDIISVREYQKKRQKISLPVWRFNSSLHYHPVHCHQRGYFGETAEDFVKGGRKQKYHSRGRIELKQPIKRWPLESQFSATRAGLKLHAPRPNSPTRDTIKLEYRGWMK